MVNKKLADKITLIACKQFKTGMSFKRQRMQDIQKSEEFYYGKKRRTLIGEGVARLPIMSGFVDTLLSKIDDPPIVNFGWTDLADYKRAMKVQAAWGIDSGTNRGNWNLKDRWEKKLAIFSGRGISKVYSESFPKYQHHMDVVDHNNFVCEPKGGGHLRNHIFMGEQNIWKSGTELLDGAKEKIYDARQVMKLIAATGGSEEKVNDEIYSDSERRYRELGIDMESHSYVGIPIYRLVEWYMLYEGEWYYLLFDYRTAVWVRAEKLKDVFESGFPPYVSWATHSDAGLFWSKAPADDARPLCDIMDALFTQVLKNRQKINSGMRAYDPDMIPHPGQLKYRPDGLVEVEVKTGKTLKDAFYEFKTDSFNGTIRLLNYLDAILGVKTGVTPATQGVAEEEKVGIYFGNLQKVADRLGLYNKSYKEAWEEKGLKYFYGLKEHCPEKMMVKMMGSHGIEWDELRKEDTEPVSEFDITITGGMAEERANELKKRDKKDAMIMIMKDPELRAETNTQWRLKQILTIAGWDEANMKMAMEKEKLVNLEILSEAEQVFQDIILGRKPRRNRGATLSFVKYLLDCAYEKIDFEKVEGDRKEKQKREWFDKLMGYIEEHMPIAAENLVREARITTLLKPKEKAQPPAELPISETIRMKEPLPGTPGEALGQSQRISRLVRGEPVSA